jgi:hypothetical protein
MRDTISPEVPMRFEAFSFGSIRIDGVTYEHDVVVDGSQVRKRRKRPSKKSSATNLDTRPSLSRRKYRGTVGD